MIFSRRHWGGGGEEKERIIYICILHVDILLWECSFMSKHLPNLIERIE